MTGTHGTDEIVPANGRIVAVDILRGLAILWVVVLHLWSFMAHGYRIADSRHLYYGRLADRVREADPWAAFTAMTDLLFRSGGDGVAMFMTLSGFSLTVVAMRSGATVAPWRFYPSRLRKLLIPYWFGWAWFIATLAVLALYRTKVDGGTFQWNFQHLGLLRQLDLDRAIAGLLIFPRGLSAQNLFAPAPTLWFVLLLLQYYLLFPLLLVALKRTNVAVFAVVTLAISFASTAWLIWHYDGIGRYGYLSVAWAPFRVFDFGAGMAMGYLVAVRPADVRRFFGRSGMAPTAAIAGVALHTVGGIIAGRFGYWNALSYPMIAGGLALVMFTVVAVRPGALLASSLARLVAFVGTLSYTVLIVNETFRMLNQYFVFKGWEYSPGWWYFIVVLYVPLSVVLAYPLAAVLGLLPKTAPKAGRPEREVAIPAVAPAAVAEST